MRGLVFSLAFLACLMNGPAFAADDAESLKNSKEGLQALLKGDQKEFFAHALKDAEGGLAEAQLMVGSMYDTGKLGAPQDNAKALQWYKASAAQGNAEAEAKMAEIYIQGRLLPRDLPESMVWLKKSSAHGNAKADDFLGDSYLTGRGVEKDPEAAVKHYLKAANANVANSQVKLAGFYYRGKGVPADPLEGYFWLCVASKNPDSAIYGDMSSALNAIKGKLNPDDAMKVEKRADAFVASHSTQ
jgi:TPR repeat protein